MPKEGDDPYNQNLITRRAIYVEYAQAVPLKYGIDKDKLHLFFKKQMPGLREVLSCRRNRFCPEGRGAQIERGAISLLQDSSPTIRAAIHLQVLQIPYVVTSMEFERILSAYRPYQGTCRGLRSQASKENSMAPVHRLRDIHMVRSRVLFLRVLHVCCQGAVIAKEHAGERLECAIFYLDMRTHARISKILQWGKGETWSSIHPIQIPTIEPIHGVRTSYTHVNDKGK